MHACASDTWDFLIKETFPFLTKTTESGRIMTVMGMKNTSVRMEAVLPFLAKALNIIDIPQTPNTAQRASTSD